MFKAIVRVFSLIVLFGGLAAASPAFAQAQSDGQQFLRAPSSSETPNSTSKDIRLEILRAHPLYIETYNQCAHSLESNYFKQAYDIWFNIENMKLWAYSAGRTAQAVILDADAIVELIMNRGLSEPVYERLHSPSFFLALQDCYPRHPELRAMYLYKMLQSDIEGKAFALGLALLAKGGAQKILKALNTSYPLATKVIVAGSSGVAIAYAIQVYRDYMREATPEERAAAEEFLQEHKDRPNEIIAKVIAITEQKILQLEQELQNSELTQEQRQKKQELLVKLLNNLRQMRGE